MNMLEMANSSLLAAFAASDSINESNNNNSHQPYHDSRFQMPPEALSSNNETVSYYDNGIVLVLVTSALACLILATIIGNVFVITAIIIERTLRTVGNYLVLSLAVTDLLVACLVMPIGAIYEVTQEWNMGVNLCELWTFIDVLCCTASIFHLLAIACDRFWAVTTVDYIHRRKGKHVCAGIALIWLLSALISLGPMLGWKDEDFEKRIVQLKQCMVSQAMSYQIFATIFSFYAPSVLLLLLYYRIYQVAKARIKLKKQRYKYRIRRRPSNYRPRKESEIRELPSINHRPSINPDLCSSSIMAPPSSSGVYSSSATDCTTTNTTYTSDLSPNSLSPLAIVINEPKPGGCGGGGSSASSNGSHNSSGACLEPGNHHAKRMSIQQFIAYQHRKQSVLCEALGGDKEEESTIIVSVPQNIVVYVDDFGSTVCSSCTLDDRTVSPNLDEYTEMDEEEGIISIDDNTLAGFQPEEIKSDFDTIDKRITDLNHNNTGESVNNDDCVTVVEISPFTTKGSIKSKSSIRNKSNAKSNPKKLKFRNKITRYDNSERHESKAAKTLTIITGIFIVCWLPFFILALVMPLCKNCIENKFILDFCLWLGWANSSLNPFLYTIFSPDFRNAFKKLIFGSRRGMKRK